MRLGAHPVRFTAQVILLNFPAVAGINMTHEDFGRLTREPRRPPAGDAADSRASRPPAMNAPIPGEHSAMPLVSVIVLNYNGASWLERCLGSLRQQTIFARIEVLVADNASPDRSDQLAAALLQDWSNGRVIQHGQNLGFCEGNNRAAIQARGQYLLFLNNDTWLEPDCLEKLITETARAGAQASMPLVMNYDDESFQSQGASGFDIFGLPSTRCYHSDLREVLMPEGSAYLIERALFQELGGFDPEFFMYADEFDLSWRVWVSGHKAVSVPAARLHHRGAAAVNPKGGKAIRELRTSDTKRYFANRNGLLCLLKNAQHILLGMVFLQLILLAFEALVALAIVRRWSFIKRAYWRAVVDCWRLRHHIGKERRRLRSIRRRSDWSMLRFVRWRFNRLGELAHVRRIGAPKVSAG